MSTGIEIITAEMARANSLAFLRLVSILAMVVCLGTSVLFIVTLVFMVALLFSVTKVWTIRDSLQFHATVNMEFTSH